MINSNRFLRAMKCILCILKRYDQYYGSLTNYLDNQGQVGDQSNVYANKANDLVYEG